MAEIRRFPRRAPAQPPKSFDPDHLREWDLVVEALRDGRTFVRTPSRRAIVRYVRAVVELDRHHPLSVHVRRQATEIEALAERMTNAADRALLRDVAAFALPWALCELSNQAMKPLETMIRFRRTYRRRQIPRGDR